MIILIVFSIFFGFIHGNNLCGDHNTTSTPVIDYCKSRNGTLESRCCFVSNVILAIDLTDMNLIKVPDLIEYVYLINVNVIDLRLNPQLKSSEKDDFLGMQSLDYLLLPERYQCPGDRHVWQIVENVTDPPGVGCKHQNDFCTNSTDICTHANSHCVPDGPNHFLCLCKNGYYGYKCLRYGQFPTGTFFAVTVVITVVLTAFFYMTQRRYVKRD